MLLFATQCYPQPPPNNIMYVDQLFTSYMNECRISKKKTNNLLPSCVYLRLWNILCIAGSVILCARGEERKKCFMHLNKWIHCKFYIFNRFLFLLQLVSSESSQFFVFFTKIDVLIFLIKIYTISEHKNDKEWKKNCLTYYFIYGCFSILF